MASKLSEILLGKEKAQERDDTLLQLESSIERSGDSKAKGLFQKLLDLELKMGKAIISQGAGFVKEEKARLEKEREMARQIGEPKKYAPESRVYSEPIFRSEDENEVGSVFAPLFGGGEDEEMPLKIKKKKAKARLDNIIRELQQLRRVV